MTNEAYQELLLVLATMSIKQLNHLLTEIETGNIEPHSYWNLNCGCLYGNAVHDDDQDWQAAVRNAESLREEITGSDLLSPLEEELREEAQYGDNNQGNEFLSRVHDIVRQEVSRR